MNNFPKLAMTSFSHLVSDLFKGLDLISMHNTNPEPFSQSELEQTISRSFDSILKDVNLGFAPDAGTLTLRQTLADYHYETIVVDEIVTHAGAQEALFCAFYAILKGGDKVLAVAPIFEPLVQIPLNIGCEVSYVHLDSQDNWSLNIDQVESNFKLGCRLFIINFPHNPTGATLTASELQKIVALCKKYDVWLLSDEVFKGLEHSVDYSLPAVADLYDKGISVGVISKGYGVPGIRVGWLVSKNKQLLSRIVDIKGYLSICNSQIDELLASVILQKPDELTKRNLKIVLRNKELLKDFNSVFGYGVDIIIPKAGCCIFAQLNGLQPEPLMREEAKAPCSVVDSEALVKQIVKKTKYLLFPSCLFKTEVEALRIGFGGKSFMNFRNIVQESNYHE